MSARGPSSRKQQRSIRDFFASPPAMPLAKRFKAQAQALPESIQKPHPLHSAQKLPASEDEVCSCAPAAQSAGRNDVGHNTTSMTAAQEEDSACFFQHPAKASIGPDVSCHVDLFDESHQQNVADGMCQKPSVIAVTFQASNRSSAQVQCSDVMCQQGISSNVPTCRDVSMEDKENVCCDDTMV